MEQLECGTALCCTQAGASFPVGTHILAGEDVQARPLVSVHSCLCCPCHG